MPVSAKDVNVTIDDSPPQCIGVHYDTPLASAQAHFAGVGFHGVEAIRYLDRNLDCNEARRRALDAAKRGEGKCFYQGSWDYSARRCALYQFEFTSYDGDRFHGPRTPDTEAHVDYGGEG